MAAVFIMSRMKVVKVSVCIYYFWSLSDCILMNLYWLNVTKCMPCLFMQIEWIHCVSVLSLGIFKRMKRCRSWKIKNNMHKCCLQTAGWKCLCTKETRLILAMERLLCPVRYNALTKEKWTVNTHLFRCFSEICHCVFSFWGLEGQMKACFHPWSWP